MEKIEIWRPVAGYEGLYEVSNTLRVKSLKFGKERILKLSVTWDGYLLVALWKTGKKKTCKVHRLVAEAFIPNPNNLPFVCHKDDDPANNCVDNLFWGTHKDNQEDSHNKGRHTKPKRAVFAHAPDGNMYYYESIKEAERQTRINKSHISECCRASRKHAGGFTWKYANS